MALVANLLATISANSAPLRGSLADRTGGNILASAGGSLRAPGGLKVLNPKESAGAASQLNMTCPIRTFEQMVKSNADSYSGDALYRKVIQDEAKEARKIRPVTAPVGCFVAGTLVHTKNGLVSIEQIRPGDLVLAQPEGTGEQAYKRVLKTFSFEDKEVYSIDFSDSTTIGAMIATGNHPFFVVGVGWTRADQLLSGAVLLRYDGTTCKVFNVSLVLRTPEPDVGWIQGGFGVDDRDDPLGRLIDLRNGQISIEYELDKQVTNRSVWFLEDRRLKVRVYDLEVEDHHTYYVGEMGVWVHNTNCGDVGVQLVEAAAGVRPTPSARVYSIPELLTLAGEHKGIVVVAEVDLSQAPTGV